MKLSEVKNHLQTIDQLNFQLLDGSLVPKHFHVTEVGLIHKNFIDCGGKVRNEKVVNFQLWEAEDFDHRLAPEKLFKIIELSENVLGIEDLEVEVEYQSDTIGKYGLDFDGTHFLLTSKFTNCLALDSCGIPPEKMKKNLADLSVSAPTCTPGGSCC